MREQPGSAMAGSASSAMAGAASADEAFAADLYRVLTEDGAQTVFSSASVAAALRMALCGARGQTATELAGALHEAPDAAALNLPGPPAAAGGLRALPAAVRDVAAGGSVTLRAPGMAWVQSGYPLEPAFTTQVGEAAALARADFARGPEAARAEINRVIAEQTEQKITGLLPADAIDVRTRLVLTSAIYLKAAWAEPFPEAATHDAPFYPDGPDHSSVNVPMMRGTAVRAYRRGDGYQTVMLPYWDGRLAMAVVLPDGPLATLRPAIAAGGLPGLLAGTSRYEVTLLMPRFRLEAGFDLVPALLRLGVRQAFTDQADFTGITEAERLLINAVAHKAYVDVDEQGTEAAAATAITFRPTAAFRAAEPVTMTVDRPFWFAIIYTPTGLPLFVGQVRHPHSR
jgi:serpin B